MHIVFFVEEESMEVTLKNIFQKILGVEHTLEIHNLGGKTTLLKKLPDRLKSYRHWIPEDWRIVVLIDEDRSDCRKLKEKLDDIAKNAGFVVKSNTDGSDSFKVMNRIVVEELESWFFGDAEALGKAYPGVEALVKNKSGFRDPDSIGGGTWESLERLLRKKGYHSGGLAKIKAARDISQYMNPSRNRSKSFQVFRDGLKFIIGDSGGQLTLNDGQLTLPFLI